MMRLLLLPLLLLAVPAAAENLKVLTGGAFKPVLVDMLPDFEKQTGHKVTVENDTAGALTRRIMSGEAFDIVILPLARLDELSAQGKVIDDSMTTRMLAQRILESAGYRVDTAPDGLVIEGFGGGHLPPDLLDVLDRAVAKGIPTVIASRCGDGPTLGSTYAVPGAEIDLRARGAIMAGSLSGVKARLRLAVALATDTPPAAAFPTS